MAGSYVPGDVLGQGGVPVWENQPAAVPVFDNLAAPDSQNWSGDKAHQPGAKGHWQRQQPGNCFSAVCQLPANLLHAHYLDDFGPGSGVRLHALPWKSAAGPDGLFHLPLRQSGPRLCDWAVCLHHPDGHGRNPWGQQDVVQSKDCLAAIERDWRCDGYWLSGSMPDAYGAGAFYGVSVCTGKGK